jgi:hypothetical protein
VPATRGGSGGTRPIRSWPASKRTPAAPGGASGRIPAPRPPGSTAPNGARAGGLGRARPRRFDVLTQTKQFELHRYERLLRSRAASRATCTRPTPGSTAPASPSAGACRRSPARPPRGRGWARRCRSDPDAGAGACARRSDGPGGERRVGRGRAVGPDTAASRVLRARPRLSGRPSRSCSWRLRHGRPRQPSPADGGRHRVVRDHQRHAPRTRARGPSRGPPPSGGPDHAGGGRECGDPGRGACRPARAFGESSRRFC